MRRFFKWLGISLILVIGILYTVISFRQHLKFDAPYPDISAVKDPAVIARGRALVYGPAHCAGCHGPLGGEELTNKGQELPLSGGTPFYLPLGTMYAPNITPHATGIGKMSDRAIARSLRYGVGFDGRALFDFMPFHETSDEDLVAIISYLRSQPPVDNPVDRNRFNLLGQMVNAFLLKPVGPSAPVPGLVKHDTSVTYGRYLANSVANCRGCHTNRDLMTGAFIGPDYAGGFQMEEDTDSGMLVFTTPNLTPHETSWIKGWTIDQFKARFRMGTLYKGSHMPWAQFGKMSDDELTAIYHYLQTLEPVNNSIKQTFSFEKKK